MTIGGACPQWGQDYFDRDVSIGMLKQLRQDSNETESCPQWGQRIAAATFRSRYCAARILYGAPASSRTADAGCVVLFPVSALLCYSLAARRLNAYLVRGLGEVKIPGIEPSVNLLVHAVGGVQVRRLARTLHWLKANGYQPEAFDDSFYLRIGALLDHPGYGVRQVKGLVEREA
ncbi:MAG: hypothetical protein ACREUA_11460 [Burkholderiales bacterium]